MTVTVTVWSDIHCPWAAVAVARLRAARDRHDLDVVFDQRAWPLEWINQEGPPERILRAEVAVLSGVEPDLFSYFRGKNWPSTFLPAFELVAAARRMFGLRAAEDVDWALRRRFFRESADVSQRHELHRAALDAGVDADALLQVWEQEPVRADVVADYQTSKGLPIQGSPQIFWPDGSTTHNPGLRDHAWVRGFPVVGQEDSGEAERLLLAAMEPLPVTPR